VVSVRITIPRSAHTLYLCVLCGSENKQRLFPYTALTGWVYSRDGECVYCAVRTGSFNTIQVNVSIYGVQMVTHAWQPSDLLAKE